MKNESLTKINLRRRELLAGTASFLLGMSQSRAAVIFDHLPWAPNAGNPPTPAKPGPWLFFSGPEGKAMEAIADRIIPSEPETPGGNLRVQVGIGGGDHAHVGAERPGRSDALELTGL